MSETQALESSFVAACCDVGIGANDRAVIQSLLAPLRDKSPITHVHYLHSLRVALKAREIARFNALEERPILFAGALHYIGKAQTPLKTLGKTGEWTSDDQRAMTRHVMDGYRALRGKFDFTAEIILWHHRFQVNGYPKKLPPLMHGYSDATKLLIVEYGRTLALADVYDALHRRNDKHGILTEAQIREQMLAYNPDRARLIELLYKAGILGSSQ